MALQDELATPQGDVDLNRDRQLVERAQAGDGSAFAELYTCYYDRLRRFCVRRLHDDAESHDVAQEAFAKAWRALPSFAGERRFYPWLTVIAANLCTDVLRRRTRSNLTGDFDAVERLETRPSLDDSIEDRVVAGVENRMALQALDRLSERHRRVLVLREGSGWSYQKIARHEGVEISAIETLLWRARQALKREYAAVSGGALALLALPLAAGRSLLRLGRRVGAAVAPHLPFDGRTFERISGLQASLAAVAGSAVVAAATFGGLAAFGSPASTHVPTPAVVPSTGSPFVSDGLSASTGTGSGGSSSSSPPPPGPTSGPPNNPLGSVSSSPSGSGGSGSGPLGSASVSPGAAVSGVSATVSGAAAPVTQPLGAAAAGVTSSVQSAAQGAAGAVQSAAQTLALAANSIASTANSVTGGLSGAPSTSLPTPAPVGSGNPLSSLGAG